MAQHKTGDGATEYRNADDAEDWRDVQRLQ